MYGVFQGAARPSIGWTMAALALGLGLLGGCALGDGLERGAGAQLAPTQQDAAMAPKETAPRLPSEAEWAVRQCRPPKSLCGVTLRELEQGGFLDFRTGAITERSAPALLSPFAVVRIEALDRARCPDKLCAAHVALARLQEELLKQGYYTQSIVVLAGSAVITLRSERIDRTMQVLKGSCRFDLDQGCVDFDAWPQDDRKSAEQCGLAQTRVFIAAATPPQFVPAASFTPPASGRVGAGAEALRAAAFDSASVKVYELVYVHKICRSAMVLVRNG